ncbi:MAG: 5-methyltetrahydropteroyltriglutamate--homocysteine S-methyltransferase, partial [Solirubrobacterales bacterium]
MSLSNISGFPRIGPARELKFATEGHWRGEVGREDLLARAREIRIENWRFMQEAGIDLIPSNDFSLYDQVLDTLALVGAVPDRYEHPGGDVDLETYFAMARGRQSGGVDVTAMEMTKWFDTNYHYIVPELGPETGFSVSSSKPFDEYAEAQEELGLDTVPVLIGPVTLLLLGKSADGVPESFDRLSLIEPLLEVYGEVLERLGEHGATWVQIDEPIFVMDRSERELDALRLACEELAGARERPRLVVKTYFDHPGDAYDVLANAPIDGVGLDLHRGPHNVELIAKHGGLEDKTLFAGVVDGRNVWINDLERSVELLGGLQDRCAELVVSSSCSLLHSPDDLDAEPDLDAELRSWMAFARQKVTEVAVVTRGLDEGFESIDDELE